MFVVPLSAYAGYPHRTPKLALCLDLDECQDPVYAFVPEPELALSSDTDIARARYLRATEERRAARQAYADSIVLDQLHRLKQPQESVLSLSLQPRSASARPRRHAEPSDELIRTRTLQADERRLREEDEIQRRRQALMAEQAQASRMRAREHAFAQALRVARNIVNRSPPLPKVAVVPAATAASTSNHPALETEHPTARLCITAAPSERASTSAPQRRAHGSALEAVELLDAQFAALPPGCSAAQRRHLLTGLLERADAVESGGSEPVRSARRALVRRVQDALDGIDRC